MEDICNCPHIEAVFFELLVERIWGHGVVKASYSHLKSLGQLIRMKICPMFFQISDNSSKGIWIRSTYYLDKLELAARVIFATYWWGQCRRKRNLILWYFFIRRLGGHWLNWLVQVDWEYRNHHGECRRSNMVVRTSLGRSWLEATLSSSCSFAKVSFCRVGRTNPTASEVSIMTDWSLSFMATMGSLLNVLFNSY